MSRSSKGFKPTLMWIDGTIFNINDSPIEKTLSEAEIQEQIKLFNIKSNESGDLYTTFQMPSIYYTELYNNFYMDLRRITGTKAKLFVPRSGDNEFVSITGSSYECIASAREQLHTLFREIRNKCPPRQFISIPTLNEDIHTKVLQFKKDILLHNETESIMGIEESIFQKPQKLHITIEVFSLLDNREENEAIQLLNKCKRDVIDPLIKNKQSIKIRLKGVDCMDGNLKKVNVLFTKALFEDEELSLQTLADNMANFFYEKGFVSHPRDNVKIHVTLMNTKYRKVQGYKKWNKRVPFDASYIMKQYENYDFGVCTFDTVHLSIMAAVAEDSFYDSLATIKI